MTEERTQPELLRIVSAVLLGCIVGVIIFLIFALGIGVINDKLHMSIPVNLLIAENLISAAMLVIFVIASVAIFLRMVWNTPPSEPAQEDEEENE